VLQKNSLLALSFNTGKINRIAVRLILFLLVGRALQTQSSQQTLLYDLTSIVSRIKGHFFDLV